MGRPRDPLSVDYDEFARTFLELLLGDVFGWHSARVTSPAGEPVDNGGLTLHERALVRSLYYNLNSTGAEGPQGGRWVKNEQWSLQLGGWGDPDSDAGPVGRLLGLGDRRRVLYCRIVRGFSAREAVADMSPDRVYVVDARLQSQTQAL